MRARACATLIAAVLAGIAPAGAVVAAQPSTTPSAGEPTGTGRTVVTDGHVDLGPRFIDGTWRIQIRDDTARPVVWRDLSDIVLHTVDTATVTVPPDPAFAFLGQAGAKVWVLPQTQRAGILWPGWNTQDPTVIQRVNREVTWRLHGVVGPGTFALFLTGNFGAPRVLFDSTRPFPQETGIEVGSHVHGNWAFTAPGTYLLDVEMLATTVDGAPATDRATARIFVGPGDPSTAFSIATSTPVPTTAPATSSGEPAPGAAEQPRAGQSRATPWLTAGGGALAVLLLGTGALVWRRRARSPRGQAR